MTAVEASSLRAAFAAGTGKTAWDVASRSLSFAMAVLVARALGAAGYGTFAVYWYTAWMLSQATDLGLHLVSLRSLAKGQNPSIFWSAVAAKGLLTMAVMLAVAAAVTAGSFSPNLLLVFVLLAAHLMTSWVEFCGVVLRSEGFIAREGLLLTGLRFGSLAAAYWALSRNASLTALAGALVLAGVPALGAAMVLVRRTVHVRGSPATRHETLRLFKASFPLALGAVITLLYLRADLFILAALRDANETGLFQSAFRLFEATFVLSGGIAAGTFPILASRLGTPRFDVLTRFLLVLLASAGGALACVFVLLGEPIVTIMFGQDFRPAAIPLAILGLGLVPVFANALTTHLLVAAGRTRFLVLALGVRLVVSVSLDLVLVPRLGAAGAAIAVTLAEWCLLAVSLTWVLDLLGFPRRARTVSRKQASSCS